MLLTNTMKLESQPDMNTTTSIILR